MKTEYIKIVDNDPTKKARIVTRKLSENDYEIIDMYIPIECNSLTIGDEILKEVTADADREGITLHVDINNILSKKDR